MSSLHPALPQDRTRPLDVAIIPSEPGERPHVILLGVVLAIGAWVLLTVVSYYCFRGLFGMPSSAGPGNADAYALVFSSFAIVVAPIGWIFVQRTRSWRRSRDHLLRQLAAEPAGCISRESAGRLLVQAWQQRITGHPALVGVSKTFPEDILAIEQAFHLHLPRIFIEANVTAAAITASAKSWRRSPPQDQRVETFRAGLAAFLIACAVFVMLSIVAYLLTRNSPSAFPLIIPISPVISGIVFFTVRLLHKSRIWFDDGRIFVQHSGPFSRKTSAFELNPQECIVLIRLRRERYFVCVLWEFRPVAGETPFFAISLDPRNSPWEAPLRKILAAQLGTA